jgi:hypothetical protein
MLFLIAIVIIIIITIIREGEGRQLSLSYFSSWESPFFGKMIRDHKHVIVQLVQNSFYESMPVDDHSSTVSTHISSQLLFVLFEGVIIGEQCFGIDPIHNHIVILV